MSETETGVDLDQIRQAYALLLEQPPNILRVMMGAISNLLQRLGRRFETKEDLRVLLIILENPLLTRRSNQQELLFHHHLLRRIYGYLSRLNSDLVKFIICWASQFSPEVFKQRIECLHHFIATRLKEVLKPPHGRMTASDWSLTAAARVMSLFFSANDVVKKVPISEFYNTLVDSIDLLYDYDCWQKSKAPFSFCQYPFLISMGSKIKIMEIDARRQMEQELKEAVLYSMLRRDIDIVPYLILHIRRDRLISDSLNQVRI